MSKPITNFFGITDCVLKKSNIPTDEEIQKHKTIVNLRVK